MWYPYVAKVFIITISAVFCKNRYRIPKDRYPEGTEFFVTDFFVRGCNNFIDRCPPSYKYQRICARNFNGEYRDFNTYCDMQFENCQTWRNWRVFKREKC